MQEYIKVSYETNKKPEIFREIEHSNFCATESGKIVLDKEIPKRNNVKNVYYPFGTSDVETVFDIFPMADNVIMTGAEEVGLDLLDTENSGYKKSTRRFSEIFKNKRYL